MRLLACPLQLLHSSRHGIARIRSLLPDLEGSALLTTFNVKVSSSSVSAKSIALFTGVIDVIDQTSKSLCYFINVALISKWKASLLSKGIVRFEKIAR